LAIDDDVFKNIIVEHDNQDPIKIEDSNPTKYKVHTMPWGVVSLENLFDLREKF
jgi:hypothetical protein